MIAYRIGDRAIFLFGFAKHERDNISASDEQALALAGSALLAFDSAAIRKSLLAGELREIANDGEA